MENIAAIVAAMALAVFGVCSALSCSPRIVEHLIVQRDTTFISNTDSVHHYQRDSIYIREKGDTIYIYKEHIRWRDRVRIDTLLRVERDSIVVERPVEDKVEKPLSLAQRLKLRLFWGLMAASLLLGAWTFRKPLLKLLPL